MRILNDIQLDFSDVLILPKRSTLKTRSEVVVDRRFSFKHTKTDWTGYPIIAANMLTGSFAMAKKLSSLCCMTALHKYHSIDNLLNFSLTSENYLQDYLHNTFYSLGITKNDYDKFVSFSNKLSEKLGYQSHPQKICIDVANGYMEQFVEFVKMFRKKYPACIIMAGNVVTGEMTEELILAGADIVKIGIGSGANCLTRRVAGVGRPQLSALIECADHAHGLGGLVCSDGGITQPADLNIAFAAGADFVMLGSMLSGYDECEGEIVIKDGIPHKKFFGMSSNSAMEKFSNGKEKYKASEGRTTLVPVKGPVQEIIDELKGSTRSMLSYIGAKQLKEASKRATLIRVNNRLSNSMEKYTIGN